MGPNNPVWIWTRGAVEKWHDVTVRRDSLWGISYEKSTTCDGCWRTLARTQVDSMRVGVKTRAQNIIEPVGYVTLVFVVWAAVCMLVAPRDPQC